MNLNLESPHCGLSYSKMFIKDLFLSRDSAINTHKTEVSS